jgi:hypothetical protein
VRLCSCATVYPDRERSIIGRRGCAECGGDGVLPTAVTDEQRASLAAGGWREDSGRWRHRLYGTARVEAALELAASDARNLRRAGA